MSKSFCSPRLHPSEVIYGSLRKSMNLPNEVHKSLFLVLVSSPVFKQSMYLQFGSRKLFQQSMHLLIKSSLVCWQSMHLPFRCRLCTYHQGAVQSLGSPGKRPYFPPAGSLNEDTGPRPFQPGPGFHQCPCPEYIIIVSFMVIFAKWLLISHHCYLLHCRVMYFALRLLSLKTKLCLCK